MRVYLIMPFPGSQQSSTVDWAYFLHRSIVWVRIIGLLGLVPLFYRQWFTARWYTKIGFSVLLLVYGAVYYMCNYEFPADTMFKKISAVNMCLPAQNKIDENKLIIGLVYNDEQRAYPIEIIGYHHQVNDTINGKSVLVTYCTVCRTGRAYNPIVNQKEEAFRLVGMDVFNAMFEDYTTKSWWQQATGVCIAGPLKGKKLDEIPTQQMPLAEWIKRYPKTLILQEDPAFAKDYGDLANYDEGTIKSSLEGRNTASWKPKSWVIGFLAESTAYAVDWNLLEKKQLLQSENFVLVMLRDKKSFFVYQNKNNHTFTWDNEQNMLTDAATLSKWNNKGECVEGELNGERLTALPAYQEFWHSWQTFHPNTKKITQ